MTLDAGISGIILSTVETLEQAKEFYDYCIYPNKNIKEVFKSDAKGVVRKRLFSETGGKRGQGLVRENLWGNKPLEFRKPIIIPQIETIAGVKNIEAISKLDFDYYLVGPYDLSASIGSVGDFESKEFLECLDKLEEVVGDKMGFHIPSKVEDLYKNYKNYKFIAMGMDTTFLSERIQKIENI
jgi:2-dehydro-3-deoxyglucarate aldolase